MVSLRVVALFFVLCRLVRSAVAWSLFWPRVRDMQPAVSQKLGFATNGQLLHDVVHKERQIAAVMLSFPRGYDACVPLPLA